MSSASDPTPDPFDQIEQVLASLFGADVAADAVSALRASGVSPDDLVQAGALPDLSQVSPGQLMALQAQMQQMMTSSTGEAVNWTMGKDLAVQTAREAGDQIGRAHV